jgi:hypothetical protein
MIYTTNPSDQKSKCLLICLSGVSACEKPGLEEKHPNKNRKIPADSCPAGLDHGRLFC